MDRGRRISFRGFTQRVSTRRATAAIAAAVILAIASGAALIAVRSNRTEPSPTSAAAAPFDFDIGGWEWQRVNEPAPGLVSRVANGYLGECIANGLPAACTSKDGVSWTLPAAADVLAAEGAAPFAGWSVAHGGAAWVAAGTIDPGTWRSSDGVHWSAVAIDLPGLQNARVQALTNGFAMVAQFYDGRQQASRLLLSTDGATWTLQDLPAGISMPEPGGDIGLVAAKGELPAGPAGSRVVTSSDGRNWTVLILPDGVLGLTSPMRLPSGRYVGVGTSGWAYGRKTLLISDDGVTWQTGTGPGSPLDSIALVGQRLVAISNIPSTAISALWDSSDGVSWRRIAILDGNPLSGTRVMTLGGRLGLFDGSKLTLVGAPSAGGNSTQSPLPPTSPSPAGSPTASAQAFVVGGWRWHQLNLVPDQQGTVVRVTNGYFGRCGASMCTSPNGWSWQAPADPSIFATDGAALFTPLSVAHGPGSESVVSAAEGVWYSLDGVNWKPSPAPADAHGFRAVIYSSGGFTLIGSPDDSIGGKSRICSSADGATWTTAPIGPMVGLLARGDTAGGILDQTGKTPIGAAMSYSADGRTWVPATLPKGAYASNIAYRLADGSLIVEGGEGLLRSTNGRSWVALETGWSPNSMAVAGDRIVAVVNDSGGGVAWESSDDGRTFHKLMDGAGQVYQFGDLVLLGVNGGPWVGAPLSPTESPGTTPTATRLPGSSASQAPAYTPQPTPLGGISKAEAIRIAVNAIHPPADEVASASAAVEMDSSYGRWIWSVSFLENYSGPLAANGTFAYVDFFTGEVLASGTWVS